MSSAHYDSDEELFARMAGDDGLTAFRALYDRFNVRLFNYCLHVLSNGDDADDAFQECWLAIHEKGRSGTVHVENVRSYLFRAAHNACLMHLRRNREGMVSIDDVEVPNLGDDPSRRFELRELIQLGLSTLEPSAREVFVLHDVEGFSYEEIAKLLDDSVHALRNKVWRARQQIRTILTPYIGESR